MSEQGSAAHPLHGTSTLEMDSMADTIVAKTDLGVLEAELELLEARDAVRLLADRVRLLHAAQGRLAPRALEAVKSVCACGWVGG